MIFLKRRSRQIPTFWPVVADSFLGILAVVVFLTLGYKRPNPELETFTDELRDEFASDQARGLLTSFEVSESEARIVYSADALSFEKSKWDLDSSRIEALRKHVGRFAGHVGWIRLVRIEGHADSRPIEQGAAIVPYCDNLQLSQNRARAVFNALIGLGPTEAGGLQEIIEGHRERTPPDLQFLPDMYVSGAVQVAGYGDTRPCNRSDPSDSLNRRVEIVIQFKEKEESSPSSVVSKLH